MNSLLTVLTLTLLVILSLFDVLGARPEFIEGTRGS